MRSIRVIFRAGQLRPLEPLDLPEGARLTLALLDGDDLPADGMAQAGDAAGAFDFLRDGREDLYSASDGEAV